MGKYARGGHGKGKKAQSNPFRVRNVGKKQRTRKKKSFKDVQSELQWLDGQFLELKSGKETPSVRHRMAEEGGAGHAPEDTQRLPPSVEDMLNQTLDQLKML